MDFETLKELVGTISRNKIKSIEVLGNEADKNSRPAQFYQALSDGTIKSDAEAAQFFFGSNNPRNPNYLKLKAKLKRQLINTAFFVDVNKPLYNERAKAYYQCYSDFAAANILLLRSAPKSGASILEEVFQVSVRFEFTELCLESARVLRQIYGRSLTSSQLHKKYTDIYRSYLVKRDAELRSSDCFEELIQYYIVKRAPDEEIQRLSTLYLEELSPQASQVNTVFFYYRLCLMAVIQNFACNDYEKALQACNEGLDMLRDRPNAGRDMILTIGLQKISCLTQLKHFENDEAEQTIRFCLELSEPGSFNWFRTYELHVQYYLNARRYEAAFEVYAQGVAHSNFHTLQGQVRENWQLFGGYFHLLGQLGKLSVDAVKKVVGPFRYTRFINDINVIGKDKAGMNVPLILLPVLSVLATNSIQNSDVSMDALELYRWRYLRGSLHTRSNHFIHLLALLLKSPMDPKGPPKKMKNLLAALRSETPKPSRDSTPAEIIPYEDLWEMLTGETTPRA